MTKEYSPFEHIGPKEDTEKSLQLMFAVAAYGTVQKRPDVYPIVQKLAQETGFHLSPLETVGRVRTPQE